MNTALLELLARYAQLDDSPGTHLTDDDRRSLVFYRAEQQYMRIRSIGGLEAPQRVRVWLAKVILLDEFDVRHGRAPHKQARDRRGPISHEETQLAEWVANCRDTWDKLCTYQRERLLCIPSFEPHPQGKMWDAQIELYKRLVDAAGRAPTVTSANKEEQRSARWAARVRAKRRRGTLSKHRADEVSALQYWWWAR